MGYAYVYRCKLCRKKVQMFVGCGMLRPDVCKIKSDIQAGLYGPEAIDFLKRYPDADASAVWAVHQCRCGNTQNKYHVILKAEGTPDFVCSLRCKKCGAAMQVLSEFPKTIRCPRCGYTMKKTSELHLKWD